MVSIDLTGRQAVVTGAARGLGKAVALKYAQAGAHVWLGDLREEELKETAEEIRSLGVKCGYSICDVSDYDQFEAMLEAAGDVDILAHVAGIMISSPMLEIKQEEIDRIIRINVNGTDNACRAGLRKMIPRKKGTILITSSVAGRHGHPGHAHYHLTKAADISIMQSAALTGAPHGVTVNAICPGIIRTAIWEHILDHTRKEGETREECRERSIREMIPLGRPQSAEDIADAVLFLTSPLAANITGQALNVCGGMEMN